MTTYGKRFTLIPPWDATPSQRALRYQLYNIFNSGDITGWSIKQSAVIPLHTAQVGDAGFVATNGSIDIAFGYSDATGSGALGGTTILKKAPTTLGGTIIAIDPGGQISNLRSSSWDVGPRFSGWVDFSPSITMYNNMDCCKFSWGSDWIMARFPQRAPSTTYGYTTGFYLGSYNRIANRFNNGMESWCILGGNFQDEWVTDSNTEETGGYEVDKSGIWKVASATPHIAYGHVSGSYGGNFITSQLAIFSRANGSINYGPVVGFLNGFIVSTTGTVGKAWLKDGQTVGYNIYPSGSWIALDDGNDPE